MLFQATVVSFQDLRKSVWPTFCIDVSKFLACPLHLLPFVHWRHMGSRLAQCYGDVFLDGNCRLCYLCGAICSDLYSSIPNMHVCHIQRFIHIHSYVLIMFSQTKAAIGPCFSTSLVVDAHLLLAWCRLLRIKNKAHIFNSNTIIHTFSAQYLMVIFSKHMICIFVLLSSFI